MIFTIYLPSSLEAFDLRFLFVAGGVFDLTGGDGGVLDFSTIGGGVGILVCVRTALT